MKKLSQWDEIKLRYDWKSALLTSCLILGFLGFCIFMLNKDYIIMKLEGNNKSGITTGFIIKRVEHTTVRQTGFGNRQYVDGISYYYTYKINGVTYYGHQNLGYSLVIAEELNKARKGTLPYPVTIKYEKITPNQSILWFK